MEAKSFENKNSMFLSEFCKKYNIIKEMLGIEDKKQLDLIFDGINLIISSEEEAWQEGKSIELLNKAIDIINRMAEKPMERETYFSSDKANNLIRKFYNLFKGMNINIDGELKNYLQDIFEGIYCVTESRDYMSTPVNNYPEIAIVKQNKAKCLLESLNQSLQDNQFLRK